MCFLRARIGMAPGDFTIRLNQSFVASFTWTAPSGQDGYLLAPLGGAPVAVAGTATSTTYTLSGPTCFALIATSGGTAIGITDVLCGIPGVATVGAARAGGRTR